ncbi:hypothetical protein H6B08_13910 [Phocaeicola plebeius]|mgnify:CR=1 FL=1|nr:hypothetical protein [Phocaeicola plebeius]
MLKEISYWTYFFLLKRTYLKDGGHKSDSVMFISVCLFFNIASIIYVIEYYANFKLPRLPITTKWELTSWIYAAIVLVPFIIFVYNKYFKQDKLQVLLEEYSKKSKTRLMIGRFFFFIYCIFTWIGSYVILAYFQH